MAFGATACASARADDIIQTPASPSYDLIQQFAEKSECLAFTTVARQMLLDQGVHGGRMVAFTNGMEQAFADEWRHLAHLAPVKVRLVLAHGFAVGDTPSDVVVDTVEFDANGCAISRTLLTSAAWNSILQGMAEGTRAVAADTI
jgi:hypothetical protein